MISEPHQPVLDPSTSTILVTGASGYIASHIIDQALKLGYKVRGTVRSQEKAEATAKVHNNNPNYSTAIVTDFSKPNKEIGDAVKGVTSICHVASDTTMSDDPNTVIPAVVSATEAILGAAAKEPSVKRFTLTSSSTAALTPKPGVEQVATTETWNDEAVDYAWNKKGESNGPKPNGFLVYAASKTEGERAMWKFMKEKKPGFVANAVLPDFNTGTVLKGGSSGITAKMVLDLFNNGTRFVVPPQYYIDVVDNARLHLAAAALDRDLQNERIFAFADPFSCNQTIDVIRKVRPDVKAKLEKDPNEGEDISKVPNELGAKLLKKWFGQEGYKSLEQSVKENLADA